jgi:hypothetical protein
MFKVANCDLKQGRKGLQTSTGAAIDCQHSSNNALHPAELPAAESRRKKAVLKPPHSKL